MDTTHLTSYIPTNQELAMIKEMADYLFCRVSPWWYVQNEFGCFFVNSTGQYIHWFELCVKNLFPVITAAPVLHGKIYVNQIDYQNIVYGDLTERLYVRDSLIGEMHSNFLLGIKGKQIDYSYESVYENEI